MKAYLVWGAGVDLLTGRLSGVTRITLATSPEEAEGRMYSDLRPLADAGLYITVGKALEVSKEQLQNTINQL